MNKKMQTGSRDLVAMLRLSLTTLFLLACLATFGNLAFAQRGRPDIPQPPRPKPDEIKDPPGGPREDLWKNENGLEIRRDVYKPSGQRESITIIR